MVLHLHFLLLIISRGHRLYPQVYRCLYFSCYCVKAINIAESNVLEHLGLKANKKLNALKEKFYVLLSRISSHYTRSNSKTFIPHIRLIFSCTNYVNYSQSLDQKPNHWCIYECSITHYVQLYLCNRVK